MANKKALRKRKKKQLKKALKQRSVESIAPVTQVKYVDFPSDYLPPYQEPPVDTSKRYEEIDKAYQKKLDKIYGGTVTALNHYLNDSCTMVFNCKSCRVNFFGKAGSLISDKQHQRHECGMPYSTNYGERLTSVSSFRKRRKERPSINEKQFQDMVWADLSPEQIAQKLQVNPKIIKEYFLREGLLEEIPNTLRGRTSKKSKCK